MILNAFFYLFLVIGTALWALGIQVLYPSSTIPHKLPRCAILNSAKKDLQSCSRQGLGHV